MIEDSPDKTILFQLAGGLLAFFDLMSIWSLLKTFLSNPGFVTDYYKSIQVGGPPARPLNRTQTPRVDGDGADPSSNATREYAVYKVDEFPTEEA